MQSLHRYTFLQAHTIHSLYQQLDEYCPCGEVHPPIFIEKLEVLTGLLWIHRQRDIVPRSRIHYLTSADPGVRPKILCCVPFPHRHVGFRINGAVGLLSHCCLFYISVAPRYSPDHAVELAASIAPRTHLPCESVLAAGPRITHGNFGTQFKRQVQLASAQSPGRD